MKTQGIPEDLVKSLLKATTESRQRRDTRPNSFQLLPQLHPNRILQLGPRLAFAEGPPSA
jgi:hypothetical protein